MLFWVVIGIVVAVGFVAFTGAPYVPSKRRDVRRALTQLYKLDETDVIVDIGSGDGIVLREASRLGARAIGYEIHPVLVLISKLLSRNDPKVEVRLANFWRSQLPDDMTVVYTFGDDRDITRMYERVVQESTRQGRKVAFISYAFEVANIKPTKTVGAHHLYHINPLQQPH
jgi:16S rRNA A1518/A1519 N6-dimethyltransferase RsmA/KsgA/DIM1 with predicted DNA glycosylase/AP lyase activity